MFRVFGKRLRFLFTRKNLRTLVTKFLIVLGVVWLVIEPVSFFYPFPDPLKVWVFWLSIASVATATLVTAFPSVEHEKHWPGSNVTITLKVGGLFDETGNIAIGCNECFDTAAPPIKQSSLMVQLLQSGYAGHHAALDAAITAALAAQAGLAVTPRTRTAGGKGDGYDIGTVAVLDQGGRKIFLSAFTKVHPNDPEPMTKDELWVSLNKLWKVVRVTASVNASIAVPVWGGGESLFPGSRLTLIQMILLTFAMAVKEAPVSRHLIVVVYDKEYKPDEFMKAAETIDALEF